MRLDSTRFPAAKPTGFDAGNLEKVLRLRELLNEFHKHSFLRGKLVLKGGTALNLFYLGLARLSVDIDLNYIAHIGRDEMLADRADIVKAVDQITTGLGYKLQNGVDDYALREWHLIYVNHSGATDRIQVEINFLMRACALAASPSGSGACGFPALRVSSFGYGRIVRGKDQSHDRPPPSSRSLRPFPLRTIRSASRRRHSPQTLCPLLKHHGP
jgi:Nucleotidyl transferase AbiEii toxin, Type IV TA system